MGHQGPQFQSSPLNFNAKCPSGPAECDFITLQRAEGSTNVDCPFSKAFPICFSCRGFSLAWVALLPATGWESLCCWFSGLCRMLALHFRCPLFERWFEYLQPCWKGGNADFSFQSQESTCSKNCCPGFHSLHVLKCRVREHEQDNLTHVQLCVFVPLCTYTDKITPQNQKVLIKMYSWKVLSANSKF